MSTLRKMIGVAAGLAVFAMAGSAVAVDDVTNTKHNLTPSGTGTVKLTGTASPTGTDQICVFCHTPHGASTTARPLWNRADTGQTYTMYDNAWSSSINMTVETTPQGVSLACLSCHDGTLALDAFRNAPGPGDSGTVGSEGFTFAAGTVDADNSMLDTSIANLGIDLRNDHPISVTYNHLLDSGFNDGAGLTNTPLRNGRVECSSCHNPHDATLDTFLRVTMTGSALCLECHIK